MQRVARLTASVLISILLASCIPVIEQEQVLPHEPVHPPRAAETAVEKVTPTPVARPTRGAKSWPRDIPGDMLTDALYRPFDIKIADRFLTPAVKQRIIDSYRNRFLRSGMPYYSTAHFGKPKLPPALRLSGEQWAAAIPNAPLVEYRGPCPLCGEKFKGLHVNRDEQWTGATKCCGKTLYSRAEDLPEGYAVPYDATLALPGMDGKVHSFDYPSTPKETIFLPAGLISTEIQNQLFYTVMPSLTLRVLMEDDGEAASALAGILDREAEVFSFAPWINIKRTDPTGFAHYRDVPKMLPSTATELAASFQGAPEEYISGEDYQRLNQILLDAPIGTMAGTVKPDIMILGREWRTTRQGTLAEAWDAISERPETRAYSEKKYGDADELKRRMLDMLKLQAAFVRHNNFSRGNFVISEFAGAVPLAVLTRDHAMAQNIVEKIFTHLWNHYYAEGISHEGAFNYSHMMSAAFDPIVAEEAFGVDFTERFPWVNRIYENWDYPVTTLLNIESTHADEHTAFFASKNRPAPEAVEYDRHEKSQTFTDYGLTCLRAGEPGSRLEVIMSHQNSIMHTDPDRLGIQLFYEGVNLLPDIGYMTDGSQVAMAKAKIVKSEFPIIPEPLKSRYDYNDAAEAHCNALINGNQFGLHGTTFERFMGGQGKGEAAYVSQFVQVDGTPVYYKHIDPVTTYSRQLMTINFPDGQPVVFDVFRLQGGRRHDFFWHVPATTPKSSLGDPRSPAATNLHEYFTAYADPKPGWQKEEDPFLTFYKTKGWPYKDDILKKLVQPMVWIPEKGSAWWFDWHVDPERYFPETRTANPELDQWKRFLQPVNLRIWGVTDDAKATDRILAAKGPWASKLIGFGGLQYENALSYLVEHRQGTTNLASTFVHLLEPYTDKQEPEVRRITPIYDSRTTDSDGKALKIETVKGAMAYVATTLNGGSFESDQLNMTGRAGVVLPASHSLSLYDGSSLQVGGISLRLDDSYETRLVELAGDLTGQPTESSLFVASDRPIPTNGVLNGHTITVLPETGKAHSIGYRIEHISRMESGLYRIDLAGFPRFTQYRLNVAKYDESNPLRIDADRQNIVGCNQPYLIGRKIYFPRSGFESTITGTTARGYRAYYNDTWFFADTPPKGAIREGDPMIIYAIQPGDTALIPSFFARRTDKAGSALSIQSSGRADLILPGGPTFANLPDGVETVSRNGSTTLRLQPGSYRLDFQK